MSELMIKIDNVSKEYRLGAIGGTTLKEDLARWHAKIHKKEDPTLKIGQSSENFGEKFLALNGVSFEVKKGEAVGIIGHNGAGKSTLLKLLSRVTAPSDGTIGLNGRIASMLEVGTGFHPELTGRENIYLNGAILGMTKDEITDKIEDIIEFSECRQFIDTPVKRYSSGMYVKLAFSVAAHLDSEIMIMDEVLAVGDMNFQLKCINRMRELANSGRTVLYVSHNMNTIRQLCDRCVVLSHGQVCFDGDVEEAISIYSNLTGYEVCAKVDLSDKVRIDGGENKVRFDSVEIIDKPNMTLKRGEPFNFKLTLDSTSNIDCVQIRFVVYNTSNSPIGMAYTEILPDIKKGLNSFNLKFDTGMLPPKDYQINLVLFSFNNGIQVRQDILEQAFYLQILNNTQDDEEPDWNYSAWGNVRFSQIKII